MCCLLEQFKSGHSLCHSAHMTRLCPTLKRTALAFVLGAALGSGALAQVVNNPEILYQEAEALIRQGHLDLAQRKLDDLVNLSGGDPQVQLQAGILLSNYGYYKKALTRFEYVRQRRPTSVDVNYDIAVATYYLKQFRESSEALERIPREKRSDPDWFNLRGKVSIELGNVPEGFDNLQQAIRLDPKNQDYYLDLSLAFVEFNTFEPPILILQHADAAGLLLPKTRLALASLYLFNAQLPDAQRIFREVIHADPTNELAHLFLGYSYYYNLQHSEARNAFSELIAKFPRNAWGYLFLARVELDEQNPDIERVHALLRRAIELNPKLAEAYRQEGRAYFRQQQFDLAIRSLSKALSLDSKVEEAHQLLAQAYTKTGNRQAALKESQLALEITERKHILHPDTKLIFQVLAPK